MTTIENQEKEKERIANRRCYEPIISCNVNDEAETVKTEKKTIKKIFNLLKKNSKPLSKLTKSELENKSCFAFCFREKIFNEVGVFYVDEGIIKDRNFYGSKNEQTYEFDTVSGKITFGLRINNISTEKCNSWKNIWFVEKDFMDRIKLMLTIN